VSFLQAAHVKDLLCLIRAVASQYDEIAWVRYLTLWPRIGDATAARIISHIQKSESIDNALRGLESQFPNQRQIVKGPKLILKVPKGQKLQSVISFVLNQVCIPMSVV